MSDDAERKLTPANENPWYWLATVHGEQEEGASWKLFDKDLAAKNRATWNRWMASALSDQGRAEAAPKHLSASELTPLSDDERTDLLIAFAARTNRADVALPDPKEEIDFSNVHFQRPVSFDGFLFPTVASLFEATFSGYARFNQAVFTSYADFRRTKFVRNAHFEATMFAGVADFMLAAFSRDTSFQQAAFSDNAEFESATFSARAAFKNTNFFGYVNCRGAEFSDNATFENVLFSGNAIFSKAVLTRNANFQGVAFCENAAFDEVGFHGYTSFSHAQFCHRADFRGSAFEGSVIFAGTRFKTLMPDFRNAELREATEWHGAEWPASPKNKDDAQQQVYAYERLKAEMERLKKHADEQFFFAKELRARRALEPRGSLQWLLNYAYEISSGYGQSVGQPIFWLVVLFALGADFFALAPVHGGAPLPWDVAAGLSFTNLFSFLPYKPKLEELSTAAKIIGDFQSVLGLVLLFLLGLGLRNRFRMK